jgi:hypothetical protein
MQALETRLKNLQKESHLLRRIDGETGDFREETFDQIALLWNGLALKGPFGDSEATCFVRFSAGGKRCLGDLRRRHSDL